MECWEDQMKSIMYAMRLYYFSGRNIRKLDNAYECLESYTGVLYKVDTREYLLWFLLWPFTVLN